MELEFDNIFEALTEDPDEAADLAFRADLMMVLVGIFRRRGWNQAEIGKALGVSQPRVSELMRGKIDLFSADKLIGFLARLNIRLQPTLDENSRVHCDVLQPA